MSSKKKYFCKKCAIHVKYYNKNRHLNSKKHKNFIDPFLEISEKEYTKKYLKNILPKELINIVLEYNKKDLDLFIF